MQSVKRAKRVAGVALLGAAVAAMLLGSPHARADVISRPCLLPPCPTDSHGQSNPTPVPATAAQATPTPTAQALALTLATPIPTPSLPDTGFAESNEVVQGQEPWAPQLTTSNGPPPAVANYASAPGFGSVGMPLLIIFAVLGSGAWAIRRRL